MVRKNGSSALKSSRSVIVVVMTGPRYVHACAVRRAKSANLIGGADQHKWCELTAVEVMRGLSNPNHPAAGLIRGAATDVDA